ncbi:DUF4350 domain-containing protein [Aurantiacibacter sp. D1-12]|uniref:DUF4350 domain-containing protein n=1 Tax=Aurantiacibacter sp. D1-12 TaxID=2993658 RepID=UPI00237CC43C|nr:DUF4350 domain-containing protein [Aurantiacibacter sp. D1-12]MDE1467076.1 DUF4350 domain-containing protein [Aurantiacibacter sp. D1-12]
MPKLMNRIVGVLFAVVTLIAVPAATAQQVGDPDYQPSIERVETDEEGPVVAVDAAHANFHQIDGRFGAFAVLAEHGGFSVRASDMAFSADALDDVDILVMSNALQSPTNDEIDALLAWVEQGGSLLLIADHAPFGGFAAPVAERLGIAMGDGYVVIGGRNNTSGIIDFAGLDLGSHPILHRDAERAVREVRSFLGQSLTVPEGASPLLLLPDDAVEVPDRPSIAAYASGEMDGSHVGDRVQALAMPWGEGRIVVSGEAAMLTSQLAGGRSIGVTSADNEAYVLNVLDWLAGRI